MFLSCYFEYKLCFLKLKYFFWFNIHVLWKKISFRKLSAVQNDSLLKRIYHKDNDRCLKNDCNTIVIQLLDWTVNCDLKHFKSALQPDMNGSQFIIIATWYLQPVNKLYCKMCTEAVMEKIKSLNRFKSSDRSSRKYIWHSHLFHYSKRLYYNCSYHICNDLFQMGIELNMNTSV